MGNYFYDTETYVKNEETGELEPQRNCNAFTIGCLSVKGKKELFYNKEEMRKRMLEIARKEAKEGRRTYYYAHYGFYDFLAVFKQDLLKGEIRLIREQPIIAEYEKERIQFLDTSALMNMRLAEAGEKLGIKKLEMPKEIRSAMELIPYVKRDVEITETILEYIRESMKKLGVNVRSIWTMPQLAMNYFIKWLEDYKEGYDIYEIRIVDGLQRGAIVATKHHDFIKRAYRLGRCEAFQIGKWKKATLIDQNRQFPYAMTQMKVPNLRKEMYIKEPLKYMAKERLFSNYVGVAKCKIRFKVKDIGLLAARHKDYRLINPKKGTITGHWTISEIKEATTTYKDEYELLEIYEAVIYPISKKNPFKSYMKHLYEIEKREPEMKVITKILMNGLTGKFASTIRDEDIKFDYRNLDKEYKKKGYGIAGEIDNKFIYRKKLETKIPPNAHIMISTELTAISRIIMTKELLKIPKEDRLYTDTDSIIFKGKHINKFKIGNEMGEFKIEKDEDGELIDKKCEIIQEKAYKIGKRTVMAGLSKSQITENLFEDIIEGKIKNYKMIGLKQALITGELSKIGEFEERTFKITDKKKLEIELPEEYEEPDPK